ncbi:site-specific DNA-methyltransferase [Cellulosimicrobium cellulans]|uniref:site-specific DNA-methyltransferase n=1 Tax=Cellulosimicrobium cellulans TaxID=1710 RepID=UPI0020CE598C|nr:site-specific DNA-methyltransferase [Cellulosimicrobium cellulans]
MTEPFEPIDTLAGPGEAKTNAQTLARLVSEVFPEAVTEDSIDFDALKQLVGEESSTTESSAFGLVWPGKMASRRLALLPPTGTLLPRPDESVQWDSTKNIVIEGDNLEVLRLLRRSYAGKVDLVYLDPPYNTGSDLTYQDARVTSQADYESRAGLADANGRLVANTKTSGRYHADWLDMMHPRLWAASDLLRDTGFIAVSIDDNELPHLQLLLNQVFGSENHLGTLPTVMNLKGNQDQFGFAGTHEYTVIYAKNIARAQVGQFLVDDEEAETWLEDATGPYKKGANLKATGVNAPRAKRPNLWYPIYVGPGDEVSTSQRDGWEEIWPITDGSQMSWRWSREKMEADRGDVIVARSTNGISLYKKQRPELGEVPTKKPKSLLYKPEYSSGNGTAVVKTLFDGEKVFTNPKPVRLLADLVWLLGDPSAKNRSPEEPVNTVVLDLFAGSGSTGHAVMDLNAADGGHRQYILVQLDEAVDHPEYTTIADIARERLRRAGKAIADGHGLNSGNLDLGFRSYHLAESNTRKWDGTIGDQSLEDAVTTAVDNLLLGRTTDDLLVEMMLRLGLELTTPVEQQDVARSPLYNLGAGTMFAYFGTEITVEESKQIAQAIRTWRDEEGPVTEAAVVVRDTGFADSAAKLNLAAALNQAGITNLRSI